MDFWLVLHLLIYPNGLYVLKDYSPQGSSCFFYLNIHTAPKVYGVPRDGRYGEKNISRIFFCMTFIFFAELNESVYI